MADNITLNAGTGGAVLAADDITGVWHQKVKVEFGGDDSATQVDATNPLPVVQTGALPAGTNNIGDVDIASALPAGANTIGGVNIASALPAGANNIGDVDVATLPAPLDVVGGGLEATALRVTLASDSTGVLSVDDNGGSLTVDGSVSITGALPAGDNNIGNVDVVSSVLPTGAATEATLSSIDTDTTTLAGAVLAEDATAGPGDPGYQMLAVRDDDPGAQSSGDGQYEPLHVGAEGGVWVTPTPSSSGGLSIHRNIDVDETEDEIKGSAGAIYGWYIANLGLTPRYVHFYNALAVNVTVGTTTPDMTLVIPANGSDFVAANALGAHGIEFGTAITIAATTTLTGADAPGTNEIVANVFYL